MAFIKVGSSGGGAKLVGTYTANTTVYVMVFSKEETSELYELYRQYKLK